jgi:PAS domain S-box-containing protein
MNRRRFLYSLPVILLLIVVVAGWFTTDNLGNKARQEIIGESHASVLTLSIYVSATLSESQDAVISLAGSPWIAPALLSKGSRDIEEANSALDRYSSAFTAISYLMDADGMTVASSNRKAPDSFVGKSYSFRPYFKKAAKGQPGRYFALGATSGKRGFYASYPVQNQLGEVVGVVTMKKDIDDIAPFFRNYPLCFLISPDGVIFLSGTPAMVGKSLWPLDKAVGEALIASKQFGAKLSEAVLKKEIADSTEVALEGSDYFVTRKVIDSDGWSIVLLAPTDRIGFYRLIGILTTISISFLILVLSGIIYATSRSKEAIQESDRKFRLLFESMTSGFALHEIVRNTDGKPIDYRFLQVNPAFEVLTGLIAEDTIGKTALEVMPGLESSWIERYAKVVTTGESIQFENYSQPLDRHYQVTAYSPEAERFATIIEDVTERKQAEEALRESEERVRQKLESIISPEGDIGNLELADVIDSKAIQALMDQFYALTKIGIAILDLKGKVLVANGWQDICTKFHRIHPETCQNCIESDTLLRESTTPGTFRLYLCKNNMWDVSTPMVVGDKVLGNIFFGQFLLESEAIDYGFFRAQARRYGFDEVEYLAALDLVPRFGTETVNSIMRFYAGLAQMIATLSYGSLKLVRISSEQERLFDSLQESERKFRLLFESMTSGFALHEIVRDSDGKPIDYRFLQVNPAFEVLTGLIAEDAIGKTALEVMPGLESSWIERYAKVVTTGESIQFENYSQPLGRHYQVTAYSPEAERFATIIVDITDRKRAEEALRESEEKFSKAFQNASYAITITRAEDGTFVEVNDTFTTMTAFTREEALADSAIGLKLWVNEGDRQRVVAELRAGRAIIDQEYLFRTKSGKVITGLFSAQAIQLRHGPCILSSIGDITEQKVAQEALRESEERYRVLIENQGEGVGIVDTSEVFQFANPAAHRIFGVQTGELVGRHLGEFVVPEDWQVTQDKTRERQDGLKSTYELNIVRPDGSSRCLLVTETSQLDANGVMSGTFGVFRDITDMKRAEEALRGERQRLSGIIKGTGAGTWEWNVQTGEAVFNNRWAEIIGYTLDEISPVSIETWMKFAHPDDLKASGELLEKHFRGDLDYYEFESRMKHKDGSWVWVLDRGRVTTWADDRKPLLMQGTHQEITERKKAEEALHESNERHKRLLESVTDYIYTVKVADGKPVSTSHGEGCLAVTGYTSQEFEENPYLWLQMIVEEDRPAVQDHVSSVMTGATVAPLEHRIIHKSGTIRWVRSTPSLYADESGSIVSYEGLISDITERRAAEGALWESEARYRTLFDSANDSIFLIKGDQFVDCNDRTLKMFGCTREQIINQPPYQFSPERQEDGRDSKEKTLEKIAATLQGVPQSFEWQHCRYDRSVFETEVSLNRMELDGEVYILAIVRDITERKNAEEQAKVLRSKLERAERMESLGILAGGVAHDLNNILGPLVGYPDLILRKIPEGSPVVRQIGRMAESAQQAADVVQDLLMLARRGRYEMAPTDLNNVVETYLDSQGYHKLVDGKPGVKLQCNFDDNIDKVLGSGVHLSKVVMNLVLNAYEAMPDGGTLTISTSQRHLDALLGGFDKILKGEYVLLCVRDSGHGISPEDLDKVLEPYFTKKKMGTSGSGLGLSVVYGVVKDHKGYYDIFSEIGKGAEFILYFPIAQVADSPEPSCDAEVGGGEKILVIDDSQLQREVTVELLSSLGYVVAAVEHGHAAVDYLRSNRADLIVLDMIMEEGFDGLDTYREIKKTHPEQKAVIISGYSSTDRVREALKIGVRGYVKKPFTCEDIGRAVRRALDSEFGCEVNPMEAKICSDTMNKTGKLPSPHYS